MFKLVAHTLLAAGLACASLAHAGVVTLSGHLHDALNPALVGSWQLPPVFTADPVDSQQNVALYQVNLAAAQTVRFQSLGYAAGGIDPYVSLFLGTGDGASFLRSFSGAVEGDFDLSEALAAGAYTVAIGMYSNQSYAENLGTGTLGDGFTGLGGSVYGTGYYELALTTRNGGGGMPEPASLLLVLGALAAVASARRIARRQPAQPGR